MLFTGPQVEYRTEAGQDATSVLVLEELDEQAEQAVASAIAAAAAGADAEAGAGAGVRAGSTVWRTANVRANATVKGRALSKKQLSQRVAIPLAQLTRVRIHVDF